MWRHGDAFCAQVHHQQANDVGLAASQAAGVQVYLVAQAQHRLHDLEVSAKRHGLIAAAEGAPVGDDRIFVMQRHGTIRVLDAERNFYEQHNAAVHRGAHQIAEEATDLYWNELEWEHITDEEALEGFQAGLSWATILRKRPAFRAAFLNAAPNEPLQRVTALCT